MEMTGVRIVVMDRGRVKVGRLEHHPQLAFHWLLRGGRIIRRWGSSEGLEQIAADGPTAETVLDRPCDSIIPFRAVLEILEAKESAWSEHLTRASSSPARTRR